MISILGRAVVLLALGACAVGAVAGIVGGARGSADAHRLSRAMGYAFGGAMVVATLLMEVALLTHDFSVSYVAEVGSLATPLHITVVSLWSSLNGSILFWGFVLGMSTLVFTRAMRGRDPEHASYAQGALLVVGLFFSFLVAGVANPFEPTALPIPKDGPGPNALLQNHLLMIIHPPALYLGYVTMAVPFAMAISALLAGRLEASWMRTLRRFMLFSWMFLSMGILLGGWWSYEVLGWGGYWAWDPVENASFMPWLTATAALHSAMMMERSGHFKGWTLTLAMASFLLTMLGTFMTRSGVFNSVHSFTQSDIGPVFLVFIGISLVVSVVLLATRLDRLSVPTTPAIGGFFSRELSFLANNLLFVAFTFTVLLGTVFPLLKEALTGERISVGEPYFNQMSLPICAAILFLMGVGPALPWGVTSGGQAGRRWMAPGGAAIVVGIVAFAAGVREPWPLLTLTFAGFSGHVTLRELFEPALARARSKGETVPVAFLAYARRSRPRVGGYVVHAGVIVCAVAIAMSGAYKVQQDLILERGEAVPFQSYALRFDGMDQLNEPHRRADVARVTVLRGEREIGLLEPRMNHYRTMREPIGTPAVRSGPRSDLYLSLVRVGEDGSSVAVRAMEEPLVAWLWVGGVVMFLGAGFSLWPRRKEAPAGQEVTAR